MKESMSRISKGSSQHKKIKNKKLTFEIEIAKKYGVEAAIIIQHFQYSINHHKKNGTHFHEGRFWTYDSIKNLTSLYPFWTPMIIRWTIKKLEEKKVIICGNFNKHQYDRTKWYAFKDEDKFLQSYEPNELANPEQSVDKTVDKYSNPVDNHVDKCGIKNTSKIEKCKNKTLGNEPFILDKSSVIGRNGHLLKLTNAFVKTNKPIPIYTSIYSSLEEGKQPNNNHGGILKKDFGRKNTSRPVFASKITKDYVMHKTLREKLHKLGLEDHYIDQEIQNMIKYHEENPQIVLNEHKCVLGWFKNHITWRRTPSKD